MGLRVPGPGAETEPLLGKIRFSGSHGARIACSAGFSIPESLSNTVPSPLGNKPAALRGRRDPPGVLRRGALQGVFWGALTPCEELGLG